MTDTEEETFYTILDVSRDATNDEIKTAYRAKAKELHPDRNSSFSEGDGLTYTKQFQKISAAYETLSDPQKRIEYERTLLKPHKLSLGNENIQKLFGRDNSFLQKHFSREYQHNNIQHERPEENLEEPPTKLPCNDKNNPASLDAQRILPPLSEIGNSKSLTNLFHYRMAKQDPSPTIPAPNSLIDDNNKRPAEIQTNLPVPSLSIEKNPVRPNLNGINLRSFASIGSLSQMVGMIDPNLTVQTTLEITFDDSVSGCTKQVSFQRKELCPSCQFTEGTRLPDPSGVCSLCSGANVVLANAKLDIIIPPGVVDGCKKRITEQGHAAPSSRKGDLIVSVKVTPHPFIRRRGQIDVECDLPVSFVQAALGVVLQIPSIRGNVKINIQPGTQPHEVMKVEGAGFVNYRNPNQIGDMYVRIVVQVPRKLTNRQRELLRLFEKESFNCPV